MTETTDRPDIVVVLADDLGFSDIGCYGGEIDTPNLDRLGRSGVRFSQFYNSPRCSPSRASLLTGLHPHQVGIGILTGDERPFGYAGDLSPNCVTVAEALGKAGYGTYMSGKWHVAADMDNPNDSWPTRRGFERFYGTIEGAGSFYQPRSLTRDEENIEHEWLDPGFYYTDAVTQNAITFVEDHQAERGEDPFFLYVAFTAPHWPLHAPEEDIARYAGRYDAGWDELREQRLRRLVDEGIVDPSWRLTERGPSVPPWEETADKDWQARRMEVYAAQVTRMDAGIGRIVSTLERLGRLENTIIVFLSDNGGCAEELPVGDPEVFGRLPMIPQRTRDGRPVRLGNEPSIVPGAEDTYASYGRCWANLSNTPFREYKHWVHEGGIATPLIVHWPQGPGNPGEVCHTPAQLVDLLPTFLDAAGTSYPDEPNVPALEGASLLPVLHGEDRELTLYWEHEGNAGVRQGQWKLVRKYGRPWELYDVNADRTERNDVAAEHPDLVDELSAMYDQWAGRCCVIPRERIVDGYRELGRTVYVD